MSKKIFLLILLIGLSITSFSQKQNDRIKALKTAYITEKLDLSSKEAAVFWPIYNEFSKKEYQLKRVDLIGIRKKIKKDGGIESFSDKEAEVILSELIDIETKLHLAKKKMISDLKKVISIKKIIKLYKAEQEFNRRILNRLRKNRLRK
ncbi:MAG: sensor of ECF-type sigma factor [Flavobacteriaceae bacterium]